MPLIAIVDDEANIRDTVAFALQREGWEVTTYADGSDAWRAFRGAMPDLVILDILMPRTDGLELCRRIRGASETVPIIFLTSRDDEVDRVLGLELGADDYLCKPFSMRELVARARVLFRRAARRADGSQDEDATLHVGPLELDRHRFLVRWKGQAIDLTVTEFLMLQALVRHPGHVKTRVQLTREGYPHDNYVSERTIDSHVKRIRKKFEAVDPQFDRIDTVYGMGYRYQPEAS
ncbi:MAG TPA: response regulator [Thermoanaerobaculia bacterium]|nr:response regulator [Thermoanaerobaculia bacterium]